MRDKQFYINSIKMDLFRVVTAAGDTRNVLPKDSITEFLEHANKDFDRVELNDDEKELKLELGNLIDKFSLINDATSRLRWAENILTLRCRL